MKISEQLLLLAVKQSLTESIVSPIIVCDAILENKRDISILTLRKIQQLIIDRVKLGEISEIDILTWDKVYDTIAEMIGGYQW